VDKEKGRDKTTLLLLLLGDVLLVDAALLTRLPMFLLMLLLLDGTKGFPLISALLIMRAYIIALVSFGSLTLKRKPSKSAAQQQRACYAPLACSSLAAFLRSFRVCVYL